MSKSLLLLLNDTVTITSSRTLVATISTKKLLKKSPSTVNAHVECLHMSAANAAISKRIILLYLLALQSKTETMSITLLWKMRF